VEPDIPGIHIERDDIGEVVPHKDYDFNSESSPNDIALIVLKKRVDHVPTRKFAPKDAIEHSDLGWVVGYGATNKAGTENYGVRRKAPITLKAPVGPSWLQMAMHYKCDPINEFIAPKNQFGTDTCKGDSGGPVYIDVGGEWMLVGTTARSLAEDGVCGLGGIYERIEKYQKWIVDESKSHGGVWP